jgi:ribosomal protein S18 acetylase RimI-like enzyme
MNKPANGIHRLIAEQGADTLEVDDLRPEDLSDIAWSGSPAHLRHVAEALDRAATGEVDYLAVRAPGGLPVAIGGVDFTVHEGAGTLWQLSTREAFRGLGLGTRLIAEAEERIRRRGLCRAMLGVEDDNARARALYERLGYRECGHERASWERETAAGRATHVAEITLLEKTLC